MFGIKEVDTLVVGAGPSGLLTAIALAKNGTDVAIVDVAENACTSRSAILLHPGTLRLFERLGFVERIVELGYRIDHVQVYDDRQPRESIHLRQLPLAFPYAISIPQADLENILEDELNRLGVEVLWNHRLSSFERGQSEITAEVDRYSDRGTGYAISHTERLIDKTFHYRARLLVATDGYNSLARSLSHSDSASLGDDQYFVFFEFDTDMDPKHAIRLSIDENLATAQFPMNSGIARLAFQYLGLTLPSENRNKDREPIVDRYQLPSFLDDQHFADLLKTRVPWITGYINKIRYRAAVPFEKRFVKQPYHERVFLLGDAARQFGPLSSLSLNLALDEAYRLGETYTANHDTWRESENALNELAQVMIGQWKFMANLQTKSTPNEMADPWIAQNRGRILRSLPATGTALEHLAGQLFIHLKSEELALV